VLALERIEGPVREQEFARMFSVQFMHARSLGDPGLSVTRRYREPPQRSPWPPPLRFGS
jgi:hypothetical protein